MSIDIFGFVTGVYEIVGPTLLRQCGYIISCNSNASDLKREIKNLKDASTRLRHEVDHADSVGDIVEDDVWAWLTEAEGLIKSKNQILEKNVVTCCFGFVPNPRTRYILGRRAKKSLPDLRALIERGKFDEVSYHPPTELATEVKVRSATSSSTVRYVELKSRALVLKRIMADLNDHNKVGVYGMGGVGKTTLLRDVEKQARESGMFDDVVNVFVSQAPNIEDIKSKIRNKLGSMGSNEDEASKKTLLILLDDLWSKLTGVEAIESSSKVKIKWVMTSRKQELLANDMGCYPTISLGVLEEHEVWGFFGELVNNRKIEDMKNNPAIATLLKKCAGLPVSIEALANLLEKKGLSSSDLVNADVLKLGKESISGSASLELSYNYLGDTDVANLAKSLFRIIGLLGTPTVPILTLLKYTIGLGLLSSSSSSDNNIMERARRQVSTSLRMLQDASLLLVSDDIDYVKIHDIVRDVAASITSRDDHALIFDSEDGLKGLSKDDIPKLNEESGAAQGLGLLGTGNSSNNNIMERARRHVITSSLRMLQDVSLLLGSDNSDYVKISDVVRDFTASIASGDDHALAFDPDGDGRWSKEKLKQSKSVYLPCSAIPQLNDGWEFPELNIFIMEAKAGDHVSFRQKEGRGHVEVPSSFYKGMAKLKVLDFRNARLTSLPSSIQSDLRNLTTLFLHFCCIENVSVIGKLESLQILSFVGSDLAHLPRDIGELTKLRMLDLSQCSELKTIEPGTLKRLTRLEELYIKESFDGWEVEGADEPSNSRLAELNCLPRLKTLEICVPNTDTLPISLPMGDLVRYKVLIGESWDWSGVYRESRTLKLKENSKNILNEDWLQSALQTTQDLFLDGLSGNGGSFHEQCKERFKELKHLHLQNSSLIECIIWSTEWLECSAFTALESMILERMGSLTKICNGRINISSFSKLKVVRIQECHKLKSLFNLTLLKNLTDLEEIEISDCEKVQQIVIDKQIDDDDDDGAATSARCSNIFYGCSAKRPTTDNADEDYEIKNLFGNLRYLILTNLPHIKSFFTTKGGKSNESMAEPVFFNDVQKVSQSLKYKKVQLTARFALDKLQRIELTECKNVVHFTNSQVLLKLVNLESLTIAGCESLEDIFDLQGIESDVEILPKLYELKLRDLGKLKHIWKQNSKQRIKGCRKLRTVEIYECYYLRYFSNSFMCEVMENLTEINVGSCHMMESIFLEEEERESNASSFKAKLTSLKILAISHCRNLKTFISKRNNKGMTYWCYGKKAVDTTNNFFNEKVFLPSLEILILSSVGKFEKLWCGEIPPDQSYFNLEYLHVEHCGELQTVIPVSLIERLHNLKQLWVMSCDKLEVVFDLNVAWNNTKKKSKALILPQLVDVKLTDLDNLRQIMERSGSDDEIVVGFPSLNRLHVSKCNKLINLVSTTTATTLLELNSLTIVSCPGLLEVITGSGKEISEHVYKRNAITFPHLTSLSLVFLDSLTCFSSESHRFDFTCLKILKIDTCTSLKKLIKPRSNRRMRSQDEDEANTASAIVLFNEKVQLPNLEELYISNSGIVEEFWNEAPTTNSFCKLKLLEVSGCSSLQNVIPSFMVKRLQNLERLCISSCGSLQDIFKTTSSIEHNIVELERLQIAELESIGESRSQTHEIINIAFTMLTFLKLEGKIQLNNMWSGSYTLEISSLRKLVLNGINGAAVEAIMEKVCLSNLEELEVSSLEITEVWHIEPVYVESFSKLKRLEIKNCGALVKIIPFFMLKKLQNLEELVVKNCNKLETVCEPIKWLIDSESSSKPLAFFSPFQKLASIHVGECECLRSIFSSISAEQHNLDQNGETDNNSNDKIVLLPKLTHLRLADLPKFSHLLFQQAGQYLLKLPSLKEFFLVEAGDKETVTHKVAFPERLEIQLTHFFGSTSSVACDIVNALQRTQVCIIGLLGSIGLDMMAKLKQLIVNKEEAANLFDQVVDCRAGSAEDIQAKLGRELGIVYGEADVQGRAQRVRKSLLTYIRNKRLLLIFKGLSEDHEGILEAVGIPSRPDKRVDPKHFKIILVSQDKELLLKMGAKLPIIPIGHNIEDRWELFKQELEQDSRQKQEEEVAINADQEDISCFVGPNTIVLNNIMSALRTNNQIIGILGWNWHIRYLPAEIGRLLEEENLIDETVDSSYDSGVVTIQEHLKTALGITTTSNSETADECIRQILISTTTSSSSSNQLQNKRLVLVLRDLYEAVDLEAVGIPPLHQVDPKFFKIILTSDNRQVLRNMGAQQIFKIQSGYHNFYRIMDGYVDVSDFIKLADECGSDDLAKLLERKLKTRGLRDWANAFRCLKESPFKYEDRKKVIDSL